MAMESVSGEESPGQAEEKKSAKKSIKTLSKRQNEKQDNVVDQGKTELQERRERGRGYSEAMQDELGSLPRFSDTRAMGQRRLWGTSVVTAPPSGFEHRMEVAEMETPLKKSGCKEERIKVGTGME